MIGLILCGVLALPIIYQIVAYINHLMTLKNYPIGTFPLPVFGNLHQMSNFLHKDFSNLNKVYGDVFSISFGMNRLVVVNSYEAAKEVLITKSKSFAGREKDQYMGSLISDGYRNIGLSDYGPNWKFLRKLGHMALRTNGDGITLNKRIIRESEELIKRLMLLEGRSISIKEQFGVATLNVLISMLFGTRYEIDDEEFHTAVRTMDLLFTAVKRGDPTGALPWLRYFPLKCFQMVSEAVFLRGKLIKTMIEQHEISFDPNKNIDFTDTLLSLLYNKEEWPKHGVQEMNMVHIENVLSDIITGGFHTTLGAIRWTVLYLIHWPKYQQEIYQQIMKAIGGDRKPTPDDRKCLPLVEAFIQETLRHTTHIPLTIPHKTIEDTTIAGQSIPKDTTVLLNLWQIHHDERYWVQPNQFNPYRWLDPDGKYNSNQHPEFIPFSAGKRSCFGKGLAKLQIFTFLSNLLQEFEIMSNPNEPFPSLTPDYGVIMVPMPYSVILKRR